MIEMTTHDAAKFALYWRQPPERGSGELHASLVRPERYAGSMMDGDEGLRIGVLGPLVVTRDGAAVRLPRGRSRVLLAVLAMSAGYPVGVGRLAELIWSEEQPERVRASVQTVVARLRVVVPDAIVTAGGE